MKGELLQIPRTDLPRIEVRERAYRRVLHRAVILAAGAHLAAAIAIYPEPLLRLFMPEVLLGYAGPSRRGDLAPFGEDMNSRSSHLRTRGSRSAITLMRPVILGSSGTSAPHPVEPTAATGRPVPDSQARTEKPQPSGSGAGESIRIELDESWAASPGSGNVAQSEKFQVLKIKRPEYPSVAILAGIQGVVKLEVRVNIEGLVENVQVLECPEGSEDLMQAAVEAMYQWQFRPYLEDTAAIPFTVVVPFRFRLIS